MGRMWIVLGKVFLKLATYAWIAFCIYGVIQAAEKFGASPIEAAASILGGVVVGCTVMLIDALGKAVDSLHPKIDAMRQAAEVSAYSNNR